MLYFLKKAFLTFQETELSSPKFKKISGGEFLSSKNKKRPFFGKQNFLAPKNLIKLFYTLNKTPSGETRCLSNIYDLLAAQAYSFSIHLPFSNTVSQDTFGTLSPTLQYLCDLWEAIICLESHATKLVIPLISLGLASILSMCLYPHF